MNAVRIPTANPRRPPTGSRTNPAWRHLPVLLLGPALWLAFWPVLDNGFLWDDRINIIGNEDFRGLGWANLEWMLTSRLMGHYHPLTWFSLALDHTVWNLHAGGYLLTNLILHLACGGLVYLLADRLLGLLSRSPGAGPSTPETRTSQRSWAALGAALFFLVHPQRVESVSWVTERRDVLSGFFLILTVILWLAYATAPARRRRAWYLAALLAFLLSLMSKAWGITLPAVILVLDWYPLQRLEIRRPLRGWKTVIVEKIPFLLLAAIFAAVAFFSQKAVAMDMVPDHGLVKRLVQSGWGLLFYPWQTLCPSDLSPLHLLRYDFQPFSLPYFPAALLGLILTGLILLQARRRPGLTAVWLAYSITISPVLGLAQSGPQITADRYSYLATIPFAIVLAWAWQRWLAPEAVPESGPSNSPSNRTFRWIGAVAAALAIPAGLGLLTNRYAGHWRDEMALWTYALQRDPFNYVAWNNMGLALQESGQKRAALARYAEAVRLWPRYPNAIYNMGNLRNEFGDPQASLADYNLALSLDPKLVRAYNNRGNLHRDGGRFELSLADLSKAIELSPEYADAYYNRGLTWKALGQDARAIGDYSTAVALNPRFSQAYNNRANLRKSQGDTAGALADYDAALRADPFYFNAYYNRANIHRDAERWELAFEDYTRALRLNIRHAWSFIHRGQAAWKLDRLAQAESDLANALQLEPRNALFRYLAAWFLEENGRHADAWREIELAFDCAPPNWPERDLATALRKKIARQIQR